MNKYIVDHTLTTKALGKDDAHEVAMDLHNVNSINLDFQILRYLKRWTYFKITVRLRVMPGNENHTFVLSRHLVKTNNNFLFDKLISQSPFKMWSRVVVRAANNEGYHLYNGFIRDRQLYPSENPSDRSHDGLSPEQHIRIDLKDFSKGNMLWMEPMQQYKQDALDNNWFCLDVPDKTWFITIYQK